MGYYSCAAECYIDQVFGVDIGYTAGSYLHQVYAADAGCSWENVGGGHCWRRCLQAVDCSIVVVCLLN